MKLDSMQLHRPRCKACEKPINKGDLCPRCKEAKAQLAGYK